MNPSRIRAGSDNHGYSFHIQGLMPEPPQEQAVPETSSGPVRIPEEQRSLFREILELLEKNNVSFAVAGAFALREHTGICRDTKDLDLFLTPENAGLALRHLRDKGFECEVCDPVWLFKAHRDSFFVDLITGMSNAAIVVEDSWVERARPAMVEGVKTRVLAAEELVASKLFIARRERFDGADIAHVIYGTRGKLDWQHIFQLAGEHWEMILWSLVLYRYCYPAQTHYVPEKVWCDLLFRLHKVVSHPDTQAKFRGSLVDDKQFAIDMNEWGLENVMIEYRERRLKSIPAPPQLP
ncbi:MAG TPA: nucleotidyltransferase [Candidatus Sulfotelmatobacter sp.]